MKEVFP